MQIPPILDPLVSKRRADRLQSIQDPQWKRLRKWLKLKCLWIYCQSIKDGSHQDLYQWNMGKELKGLSLSSVITCYQTINQRNLASQTKAGGAEANQYTIKINMTTWKRELTLNCIMSIRTMFKGERSTLCLTLSQLGISPFLIMAQFILALIQNPKVLVPDQEFLRQDPNFRSTNSLTLEVWE